MTKNISIIISELKIYPSLILIYNLRMKTTLGLSLFLCLLLTGCSQSAQTENNTQLNQTKSTASEKLTADQVINAFSSAKLPLNNLVVYKAETDPNKLLGRPNQYIERVRWGDEAKEPAIKTHSIEIFRSAGDLETRKKYVDSVTNSLPELNEYSYAYKNVLLRLHHSLPPEVAGEYEKVLKSL